MSTIILDPGIVTATDAFATLNLDALSGPFVIGTMCAMFLQGVTLHQGGVFWLGCRRSREPIIYMVIVAIVQLMDIVHTVTCVLTIYQWTVRDYGDPTKLAISPWSFMIEPVMAAVTATIIHLFYAHRILLISDGHLIGKLSAIFISLFTFVQFAFGSAVSSKIVSYDYQFERFIAWLWGACVWLGTLAAVDIIICITYTYYLNRVAKEMSGPFVHSTQMVMKVALVVLATNGCSALVAVIATVLFGGMSGTNWHAIPQLCLEKMLTLSLLVCLNARTLLSDMIGSDQAFFHSHLKRQPLTVVVGNLIPSTAAGQLGRVGGLGNGSRVVVGSGGGGSRPGTGKSGQGEGNGEVEGGGGGTGKTFDDLAKAKERIGRKRSARGKGFEVEITRVVTEVHDEMGSAARVGIESREEEQEKKTFEEEVEEDASEGKVTNRVPFVRATSNDAYINRGQDASRTV